MNELLEQHFDTAFAAPEGIAKLRELILTLAMQGKLVEQAPNDPPASELLKEIEAEKRRLSDSSSPRRRGSSKSKPLPPIKPEEMPYELPQGWEWVRLGDITDYNGRNNISGDEIAPNTWLLDLEDIEKGTSRLLYRAAFSERQSKSTKSTFQKGDVLYGKLRPYLDKVVVADTDGVCTTEIVPIVPFRGIHPEFLRWLLKRPAFLAHVNSLMYGVKMPRLGTDDAVTSIHPLPPLQEQHRIVARIDQLMARCDALEKLRKEREEKRLTVHAAAVRQLLDASSSSSHACPREDGERGSSHSDSLDSRLGGNDGFDFIQQHFGELYTVKQNVAELRKAILQLAVMGRLVPQDPNDPPASELLKEIEAEKQRLMKTGKIKKPKPLPPIKAEEVPYELPQGWEWVRLEDVSAKIHYGYTASADHSTQNVRLLRITDIQDNKVDWETVPGCNASKEDVGQYLLADNDILIARTGGTVGKSYLVQGINVDAVFASYLIRVVPSDRVNVRFVKYFAEGPLYWKQLYAACSGTGQPNVNGTSLSQLLLALPPLPEQHRIVARIDQLMTLCDVLDQKIDTTSAKQAELLNAVMAQV